MEKSIKGRVTLEKRHLRTSRVGYFVGATLVSPLVVAVWVTWQCAFVGEPVGEATHPGRLRPLIQEGAVDVTWMPPHPR